MAEMNERLAQFMRAEQLSAAKLAEIVQVQPSSISHLLSGRNKPNFEFVSRMMRMFGALNPDWLINGIGSMYRQEDTDHRTETPIMTTVLNPYAIPATIETNLSVDQKVPSDLFSDTSVMPQAMVQQPQKPVTVPEMPCDGTGQALAMGQPQTGATPPTAPAPATEGVRQVVVLFDDQTCVVYRHR